MESVAMGQEAWLTRDADDAGFDDFAVELFRAEAASLVQVARFYVDDKTAAEDLVQEAFIRLSRSAHRIKDPAKGAAYLRSIVINLARDHNRRGLMSFRHQPPAQPDEPSAEDMAPTAPTAAKSSPPCAACPTASGTASHCATTTTSRYPTSPRPWACR
jgi:DNA-directed RNA polymerase specialized sigma24 family protein